MQQVKVFCFSSDDLESKFSLERHVNELLREFEVTHIAQSSSVGARPTGSLEGSVGVITTLTLFYVPRKNL